MIKPENLLLDTQRLCPVCDSKVHGRSDKIYCTSKCKDQHYAKKRRELATAHKVTLRQLARLPTAGRKSFCVGFIWSRR